MPALEFPASCLARLSQKGLGVFWLLSGCPHSAHQPTHSFLAQRVDLLPTTQAPGTSLIRLLSKPWAQHPEEDFLGPLSSKPPPASSAKSFPALRCLQPAFWAHTLPERFWRRVGGVGAGGWASKRPGLKRALVGDTFR